MMVLWGKRVDGSSVCGDLYNKIRGLRQQRQIRAMEVVATGESEW